MSTVQGKNIPSSIQRSAIKKAVIVALLWAPLLFVVWAIAALTISFSHGADFGGYGAGASSPTLGAQIAELLLLIVAIGLDIGIGVRTYRRKIKSSGTNNK